MVSVWKELGKIIRRKNRRYGETVAETIFQSLTLKIYLKQISALRHRKFRCRLPPSEGSHCSECGFIWWMEWGWAHFGGWSRGELSTVVLCWVFDDSVIEINWPFNGYTDAAEAITSGPWDGRWRAGVSCVTSFTFVCAVSASRPRSQVHIQLCSKRLAQRL